MPDIPPSLRWPRLAFGATRAVSAAALLVWMLLQPDPVSAITLARVAGQVAVVLPLVALMVFSDVGYRRSRERIREWQRYGAHLP